MRSLPLRFITIAATISPTSIHPTVQTRFTKLPKSMPTRQVRSSRPVPTVASMCGCAMMPTSPLTVSMAITHGPIPDGVDSEKLERPAATLSFRPVRRLPASRAESSMNDRTMIRKPWKRSVQADATSPPMKL